MARWFRIVFENAKTHLVSQSHKQMLLTEMLEQRDCTIMDMKARGLKENECANPREVTKWGIDFPGSVIINRPVEKFKWAGLHFEVPSEDVSGFIIELKRLELRKFDAPGSKSTYYKLHGFMQCIAMTEAQHERLLSLLTAIESAAEAKTDAFYVSRKKWLAERNATPNNVEFN